MSAPAKPTPVTPQEEGRRNSPIRTEQGQAATPQVDEAFCYWNDKKYSVGAEVCDNHRLYRCMRGGAQDPYWWDTGHSC
jgi:hypothetical protein